MLRPARDNVDNTGRHSRPLADGSLVFVVNYWQPGFIFFGSLVLFFLCSLVLFLFGSLAFFWQPGFCHDDEIQVHWERIKYRPGQGWWRVCPPRAWPHKYSQRQGLQQPVWIEIPEIQKKQIHNYNFKYKRTIKRTIINTQV